MTAPLCAMWLGHCGLPATIVVETMAPTGNTWTAMSFLVCAEGACRQAARWHVEAFELRYLRSRDLTKADVAGMTVVAA